MKKKLLILALLFSLNSSVFGQICGTSSTITSKSSQRTVTNSQFLNSSSFICFNVYYHIVRENNGTGGYSSSQLNNITNTLNTAYNEHNLYINNFGFDYINNSTYYNIDDIENDYTEFDALIQINNKPNAINIYIVNNAKNYSARANGILGNALVIVKDWANTQVASHEVGHCLDLLHTFQGTAANTSGCAEEINGSNCLSCGDLVCDTPADANTGNSGGYNPDMDNIMSYYYPIYHFSDGQADKIRQAFANYSSLQQIISTNCSFPKLTGSSTICGSSIETYTLENVNSNITTDWQLSSNLKRIGASNTSIGIQPLSDYSLESAWVSAYQLGKIKATKSIWLNKPLTAMQSYCEDFTQTTCYLSGITSNVQIGSTTTLALIAKGNVSEANYTDWEWQRSSGNFIFVDSPSFIDNPINGGQGSLGKTASLQVNGSGLMIFKARTRNSCGWGDWKYFFWDVYASSSSYSSNSYLETSNSIMEVPVQVDYSSYNKQLKIEILDIEKWLQARYGNTKLEERDMQKIIRFVESKNNTVNILIYNFRGEMVLAKEIINTEESISLSQLRSDIYFIKITINGLTDTKTIYLSK